MDKAKLLDLMAEKGLTQAELADKAGVSRTAVWGLLKQGRPPPPERSARLLACWACVRLS